MRGNGMKVKETGMAYLQKEMVIILKDTGLMIREKVKDPTSIVTKINFL